MKRGLLKIESKLIAGLLVASVLTGCETTTLAHRALDCLQQAKYILDDDVLANMNDIEFRMVETQVTLYQERHKSQCRAINKHNELHEK